MKAKGRITGIQVPFRSKRPVVSFEVQAEPEALEKYMDIDLDISFSRHRNRRSIDANAFLWACLERSQEPLTAIHGASICICWSGTANLHTS